jgi:uncharacterized RDD family membrane protein YckC
MRFDEVELEAVPLGELMPVADSADATTTTEHAPRGKRLLALLTDLSLFAALSLALSPLLPASMHWTTLASLAGFVVVLSYYYFVGTWMLWGKTIGGAIFDVRVVADDAHAMTLRAATMRWAGVYLSMLTAGIGFAMAALPSRLSLPDRMSASRCVSA